MFKTELVQKALFLAAILYVLFLIFDSAENFRNCTLPKQQTDHNRQTEYNESVIISNASENSAEAINRVKIVMWVWAKFPPSKGTMGRILEFLSELNQENGDYCRKAYGDEPEEWADLNCQFTLDKEAVPEADAVSFSMFNSGYSSSNLPPFRKSGQLWLSYIQEAPPHSFWANPLENLINWTMSYRADSDIWNPYGRKVPLAKPLSPDEPLLLGNVTLDKWIAGKDKLVAGAISHCKTPSKRELLIDKMNKSSGGQVDIYGSCGNKMATCGLSKNYNQACGNFWEEIGSQYKFFLAFENALCREYVTEKFWRTLEYGMVPVVYGSGFYEADAPPNSFIDARRFTSAADLMEYLEKVGNDKKRYARYFEWRKVYTVEQKRSFGFCNFCKAVRDLKMGRKKMEKTYENLKFWWNHQPGTKLSACDSPPVFDE